MPTRKRAAPATRGAHASQQAGPGAGDPGTSDIQAADPQSGDPGVSNPGVGDPGRGDLLSVGFLIGLLAGEGHFGGDGRQPQVTLRMHIRHEATFRWLERVFPGGRLYGPYTHGGRSYFQWMARGAYLREHLAPLIHQHRHLLDDYVAARFDTMCRRYTINLDAVASAPPPAGPAVP